MKRNLFLAFAAVFAVAACAEDPTAPTDPVFAAGNPHFIQASAQLDGENLNVSFKEAGLGNNQLIDYTASAFGTAMYACQNMGGNFPSDPKKQQVSGPVTATGTFDSGKNGQVTATLTIQPPASSLVCPPGQNRILADVSYTDVQISDDTNGVTRSIPGTFSATFFEI